jgi:cell migration-inducing and hyaluronan-binding protein
MSHLFDSIWRMAVIESTDYDPWQSEVRVIRNVSTDGRLLTLNTPLQNLHWGTSQSFSNGKRTFLLREMAEVGLITRNIVIQGDVDTLSSGTPGWQSGATVIILQNSTASFTSVLFHRSGKFNVLAAYGGPHWHNVGDGGRNQFMDQCAVWKSFSRCLSVHCTNGVRISENGEFISVSIVHVLFHSNAQI